MEVGIKGDTSFTVTKEMLASQDGDDTLEVFSTPMMVLKIERTAALSVLPFLEEGYTMVGIKVDVQHTAATLEGMKVYVHTELIEISENGKFLTFKAEVANPCTGNCQQKTIYGKTSRSCAFKVISSEAEVSGQVKYPVSCGL